MAVTGAAMILPLRNLMPPQTMQAIHRERATVIYGGAGDVFRANSTTQISRVRTFQLPRTGIMAGAPCPILGHAQRSR